MRTLYQEIQCSDQLIFLAVKYESIESVQPLIYLIMKCITIHSSNQFYKYTVSLSNVLLKMHWIAINTRNINKNRGSGFLNLVDAIWITGIGTMAVVELTHDNSEACGTSVYIRSNILSTTSTDGSDLGRKCSDEGVCRFTEIGSSLGDSSASHDSITVISCHRRVLMLV